MTPSREHDEAVGAEPDAAAEIAQLRAELNAPSEREVKAQRLRELEARVAAKREATGKAKAMERQKGIRRAHGSLVDQLEQDERRLIAGVKELIKLIRAFNQRYDDVTTIEREDAVLAHRFGLAPSNLQPVEGPARRRAVIEVMEQLYAVALVERTIAVAPAVETDETGLRQRRTYGEIAGSDGHKIIMEAGLTDFPPLTAQQQEIVASREATARTKEQADLLAMEAAHELVPRGGPIRRS